MIQLTRLNHQSLILNSDLIKTVERAHDTVITLVNGEKLTVEEAPQEIVDRIVRYRSALACASNPADLLAPPPGLTEEAAEIHGH